MTTLKYNRKIGAIRADFSTSCGGLQPLDAMVGPFEPNNGALRAQPKILNIHLESFTEICLNFFLFGNQFKNFADINFENFEEISLKIFAEIS